MPDNSDSIMVVIDGSNPPNAQWTSFPSSGICARRVAYPNFRRLQINNRNVVSIFVFQTNPSGPNPLKTEINGHDSYSFEHNAEINGMTVSRFTASGAGAGTRRRVLTEAASGGGQTADEFWAKENGQVPMLGVTMQDASPSSTKLTAAAALTTDDVPLT